MIDMTAWTKATGEMPWGVQSAFMTALEAVRDGDIKMVHGTDSANGSPCLVNAINSMISHGANASPSQFAAGVVGAFDQVNRELFSSIGAPNTDNTYVTPFAAEVLIHNFGPLKPQPEVEPVVVKNDDPYVEKSDSDLMNEWLDAATSEAACPPDVSEQDILAHVEEFLNDPANAHKD